MLHGLKYVLAEVKKKHGLSKEFLLSMRTVRCQFFLLEDQAAFERKKWELDEDLGVKADQRTLVGFNVVLGIGRVFDSLCRPGHDASHAEVCQWLKQAKLKDMSVKVVGTFLRVRARYTSKAVVPQLHHKFFLAF